MKVLALPLMTLSENSLMDAKDGPSGGGRRKARGHICETNTGGHSVVATYGARHQRRRPLGVEQEALYRDVAIGYHRRIPVKVHEKYV